MNLHEIITTQQDPELAESLERFVSEHLAEFKQVFAAHPLAKPKTGCISACEAFWLYCLVRVVRPMVVIESGTFEGFSLYFLRRAAPEAEIHAFDPFIKPKHVPAGVRHHRCDWTRYRFNGLPAERTLAFFDDHVNQGHRLVQALRRGIRHTIFHDNYLTPVQSHVPVRYCELLGRARHCYVFDRLRHDPLFTDTTNNPQAYRWLTYVELETERGALGRWFRRLRCKLRMKNPYMTR